MKTSLSLSRCSQFVGTAILALGLALPAAADTIGDRTSTLYTSNTTPPNTFTGTINVVSSSAVVVSNTGDVSLTINSGAILTSGGASGTLALDVTTGVSSLVVVNAGIISNTGTGNAVDLTPARADGAYVTSTVVNTGLIQGNVALGNANNTFTSNGGTLEGNLTIAGGNNQVSFTTSSVVSGSVSLGNGNNTVGVDNSTINGTVTTGSGNDTMAVQTGGLINGNVNLGAGTNSLTLNNGSISGTVTTGAGDDTLDVNSTGLVNGNVNLGGGSNTIILNNGRITGTVTTGSGNDTFTSTAGGLVTGAINLGDGANTLALTSSTVTGGITTGSGNDTMTVNSSTLGGTVDLGNGANTVQVSHTTLTASILTGAGNDVINVSNSTLVSASVSVGDGANTVTIEQTNGTAALTAGDGGSTFVVSASALTGNVSAGAGDDTLRLTDASTLSGTVALGDGTNQVIVSGSSLTGTITGGVGNDIVSLTDAILNGNMSLGLGSNSINVSNSTVSGSVTGGDGGNSVTASTATFTNGLTFGAGTDTVNLTNTTVSGSVALGNGTNGLTLNGTSRVNGDVTTGAGTDTITLNGTSYVSGSLTDSGGSGDTLAINTTNAYTPAGSITGFETISVTAPAFNIVSGVTGVGTLRIGQAATVNVSQNLILNTGGSILSSGTLHIGAGKTVSAATANLAGSILSVDIAPIVSTGQLVLTGGGLTGGTSLTINMVSHTTGFIANGTSFTVVDAAGTTSGMALTSNTYGLLYTYNLATPNGQDVVVTISRSIVPYASSTNAQAVGGALDAQSASVSGTMAQLQTLIENATTAAELNGIVESAAPSLNTMGVTALTLDRASTRQITNRLASLRGSGLEGVAAGDTNAQSQLWLQGFANGLSHDNKAETYGYTGNSHGFVLGMDSAYFDGGTTGWALSYGTGSVKSKAPGNATNDVNSLTANLYGSTVLENGMFVSGLGGLGYDSYSTKRNVTGLGTATGKTNGLHATAKVESGIDMPLWDALTLTPVVGAQYSYATMDSYTETGLGNAGLQITPDAMSTLDLSAGLEMKTYIPVGEFTYLRPSLRTVFTHRLGDDSLGGKARFIAGGPSFATVGTSEGANIITVGGGLGLLSLDGMDVNLTYDAELRDAMFGYSAQMKAKMPF